jgi:hypothetical protein
VSSNGNASCLVLWKDESGNSISELCRGNSGYVRKREQPGATSQQRSRRKEFPKLYLENIWSLFSKIYFLFYLMSLPKHHGAWGSVMVKVLRY